MWKTLKTVISSEAFRAGVALLLLLLAELLTGGSNEGEGPAE